MADWGSGRGNGHGGSRGRIGTWDVAGSRRRALAWAGILSDFRRAFAERLRNWAIADTGPGRLLPWLPVAFGLGIAIYFTAEREPDWRAAVAVAIGFGVAAAAARRRAIAFPLLLGLAAITAGFAQRPHRGACAVI